MKNLYITDLDGTLLNSKGELSPESERIIKKLISEGVLFSLATARTAATVTDMFKNVGLKLPIALMNGVAVYDPISRKNVITHKIDKSVARKVLSAYEKKGKHPMLYFNKGEYLEIVYTEIDNQRSAV